jgi:hypothetical protein
MSDSREYIELEKLFNAKLEAERRVNEAELKAVRQAVEKVEIKTVEDKASSNEFRGQLKDQAASFVTRRELWSAVVAIIGIVLAIMTYINKT